MKDEINSDIASFVTDQEYSDYDETDSQSWTEEEFMEEGEYEDDEYEDEYEDEDEDDIVDKDDFEDKRTVSGESDDESVFYENDNTDEIEPHTSAGVRSSQSVESENFVEAEENIDEEISNIVDDIIIEPFETILPPTEFSDDIDNSDETIGYTETPANDAILEELQQETIAHNEEVITSVQNQIAASSDETNQSEKSRQNSIDSQYDEETESEHSQDSSGVSEESDVVTDTEFENIKRNSIDLQENAIFIQQQLNKATTIVVSKSSPDLRDDVSPTVEIAAGSSHKSEDATDAINTQLHLIQDVIANDNASVNEVIVLESTPIQIESAQEEIIGLDEAITFTPYDTLGSEEEEAIEVSETNILVHETTSVALDLTDSVISGEGAISNDRETTSAEVEIVILNHEDNTLPEIASIETILKIETATRSLQAQNPVEAAGTASKSVPSLKAPRDDQEAGTSSASTFATSSNGSEKILPSSAGLPTSSKLAQVTKQVKNTTKTAKKIPVRKASLASSGPFGSIRTNNVRAMQQELLNKSTTKPLPTKPSKIVPPKVYTKASITTLTERITKFIKPFSTSAKASGSAVVKNVIPKKKYHETCFSDDNPTSDEEPMPVRRQVPIRQQSMPNIMERQLHEEEEETPEVNNS